MKKHKHMRWWPRPWEYRQAEAWLEDMAAKGWRLESTRSIFAKFRKAEPSNLRYRCVMHNPASLPNEVDAMIKIYKDAGWKYIDFYGSVTIYVHELGDYKITDPTDTSTQEKLAWRLVRASIIKLVASILIYATGVFVFNLSTEFYLSNLLKNEASLSLLSIWFLIYWITSIRELVLYWKRRKPSHTAQVSTKPTIVARVLYYAQAMMIFLMLVPSVSHLFTDRIAKSELCLKDVMASIELTNNVKFREPQSMDRFGLLYPEFHSEYSYGTITDKENDNFRLTAYQRYTALFPFLAYELGLKLSECQWEFNHFYLLERSADYQTNIMSFEHLWRYDDTDSGFHSIVAVKGNSAYYFCLYGPLDSTQLAAFLQQKLEDSTKD